jgi:Asparaginase
VNMTRSLVHLNESSFFPSFALFLCLLHCFIIVCRLIHIFLTHAFTLAYTHTHAHTHTHTHTHTHIHTHTHTHTNIHTLTRTLTHTHTTTHYYLAESGGIIAITTNGEYAMEFNSKGMFRAVCKYNSYVTHTIQNHTMYVVSYLHIIICLFLPPYLLILISSFSSLLLMIYFDM